MKLSDRDGNYDVVIAANVIHLPDEPQKAMAELWWVTKPNGLLIVPAFLTNERRTGFGILLRLCGLNGFQPKASYSGKSYRALMNRCGLPQPLIEIIKGKLPVGLAVFKKDDT